MVISCFLGAQFEAVYNWIAAEVPSGQSTVYRDY